MCNKMTKEELLEISKTSFVENGQFNFIQYDSEKLRKFFRDSYKLITEKQYNLEIQCQIL